MSSLSNNPEKEDEPNEVEINPNAEVDVAHIEEEDAPFTSYQPPIHAIPPRVTLTEESQMEVSASPAFQCLDDVCMMFTIELIYVISMLDGHYPGLRRKVTTGFVYKKRSINKLILELLDLDRIG